jgi:hypothetical protein
MKYLTRRDVWRGLEAKLRYGLVVEVTENKIRNACLVVAAAAAGEVDICVVGSACKK